MGRQPSALFLFAFTQMWESFSYYGMRVLLVLYLISTLKYAENDAFAIYALYTCLVEFGAVFGGYCADRFLGLRTSVVLGGGAICAGHLLLTYADHQPLFFLGLGAIICGATLFRSNLKALVGAAYENGDPRKEAGFTLFYIGINLGGFAAALLCGYAAQEYGWHAGFGLATIGMLLGMGIFVLLHPCAVMKTPIPREASPKTILYAIPGVILGCVVAGCLLAYYEVVQVIMLPIALVCLAVLMKVLWRKLPQDKASTMGALLGLLLVYFTFEELMGSLLMVFSENQVDRNFMGWEIPSSALSATNPLVIICCGPLLSLFLQKKRVSLFPRIAVAFLCLSVGFGLLYFSAVDHAATAFGMMISFSAIALGELFIAPAVYAYCSEVSPQEHKGLTMGIVTVTFALASLLSGHVSQLSNSLGEVAIPLTFLAIALLSLLLCIGLASLQMKGLKTRFLATPEG